MSNSLSRRQVLLCAAAGAAAPAFLRPLAGFAQGRADGLRFGEAQDFSYETLVARARESAKRGYEPPDRPAPEIVQEIDYETHGTIRFDPDQALFGPGGTAGESAYPATFFHLGQFFGKAIRMHALVDGKARQILYSADYFEMPADSIARKLPADSGFAGFRLQESTQRDDWRTHDWIAFLGASYFRAIGELEQYGLSARGIAVDVAAAGPEEFPDFTEFYISPAATPGEAVEVYALLDGPSVTGAYRFSLTRGDGVIMEVQKEIFLRKDIERLGLAPLTSMYWYSEGSRPYRMDWRPEIHDSDGLALWTGRGERLWRPLNNPERVTTSSFFDDDPRGFGLLQRDRNFDHFLDGVHYERRPSLWVEPLEPWGRGAVQLVEIPTDDEIHDNIVAFWVPRGRAEAGNSYRLRYRLHWLADEPYPARNIARVAASRIGRGGQPGKPRPPGIVKFVVDFEGGPLPALPEEAAPEPVVSAARGEISRVFAERVPGTDRWRAVFDLAIEGDEAVELRLYLASNGRILSETWLSQFRPGSPTRS